MGNRTAAAAVSGVAGGLVGASIGSHMGLVGYGIAISCAGPLGVIGAIAAGAVGYGLARAAKPKSTLVGLGMEPQFGFFVYLDTATGECVYLDPNTLRCWVRR